MKRVLASTKKILKWLIEINLWYGSILLTKNPAKNFLKILQVTNHQLCVTQAFLLQKCAVFCSGFILQA